MGGVVNAVGGAIGGAAKAVSKVTDIASSVANPGKLLGALGIDPMAMVGGLLPGPIADMLQNPLMQAAISAAFPGAGSLMAGLGGGGGGFPSGVFDLGSVGNMFG